MGRSILSRASSPPLHFLCTWPIMWPPTQETYCSTTTCYGGNRMRCSGLECHPQATECWVSRHWQGLLALLSPWQLNYSLKERKAQGTLLISQWDCWLSSQWAVQWKDKRQSVSLKWSVSILLNIFMKWTSPALHTIKSALSDSLTCGRADRSYVSWTDMALAAFKDTEWRCVGVWIRPLQIYWVHSHHRIYPESGSSCFKGWELCQLSSSQRVCLCSCPFITGTEPVRHAEVNLAYDILSSAESP